jgi:hypothetical protein
VVFLILCFTFRHFETKNGEFFFDLERDCIVKTS